MTIDVSPEGIRRAQAAAKKNLAADAWVSWPGESAADDATDAPGTRETKRDGESGV